MKGPAMKRMMLVAVCAAAAVMFGCVPSLQPLYTGKDLVFEPKLIGTWASADNKQALAFNKGSDDKSYEVLATDENGAVSKLDAHLVRLGNDLFFDTTVKDADLKGDFAKFHLLPAHLFTKITLSGDTLTYAALNFDWIKKQNEAKKLALRHEVIEATVVLTAPTKELREFLRKNAGTADAFQTPVEFKRKK